MVKSDSVLQDKKAEAERQKEKKAAEVERLKKEQAAAKEKLDEMMNASRPKNFAEGFTSGVGNVLGGVVAAAGVAVIAPTGGLVLGSKHGGIVGGIFGVTGGAVIGVVGGVAVGVMGVGSGIMNMGRGVMAVPRSITEPRKGKWWDEIEGVWVETNLVTEKENLSKTPADDGDILDEARKEADGADKAKDGKGEVVDTFYYDHLDIDPKAEQSKIKKQYYLLARKYHPDKVGKDDKEAADKFKEIAEAYQVLSDPELRSKYDKEGKDALSADKTSAADPTNVDPVMLFAFLFGSDKFTHYTGTLGMATAASIGDSPKVGPKDARKLQKRRCARLALLLVDRLQPFIDEGEDAARECWMAEAQDLVSASYGFELLQLIGQVYSLCAAQFLGSLDSGIGMPSIAAWANSKSAKLKSGSEARKNKQKGVFAGLNMMQLQMKAQQEIAKANTDEEKKKIEEEMQKEMTPALLNIMWLTSVVDISTTLHETCQMVLFDISVDKDTREKRGKALEAIGDALMEVPPPEEEKEGGKDAQKLYEEAAFNAMIETIKRKDEANFRASLSH